MSWPACCGRSDWAAVLLVGGSAGSRVSLLTAIRHPDVVERLFLLWISGGGVGLAALAYYYCHESLAAAAMGGMEAVAALPSWKEQLTRNPGNRERMLRQDVTAFIDTMKTWAWSFFPKEDCPVPDMLPSDLRALKDAGHDFAERCCRTSIIHVKRPRPCTR